VLLPLAQTCLILTPSSRRALWTRHLHRSYPGSTTLVLSTLRAVRGVTTHQLAASSFVVVCTDLLGRLPRAPARVRARALATLGTVEFGVRVLDDCCRLCSAHTRDCTLFMGRRLLLVGMLLRACTTLAYSGAMPLTPDGMLSLAALLGVRHSGILAVSPSPAMLRQARRAFREGDLLALDRSGKVGAILPKQFSEIMHTLEAGCVLGVGSGLGVCAPPRVPTGP
jgi:hypothetical protein